MQEPMVCTIVSQFGHDPFLILISCLLSLRTKDTTTLPICLTLFQQLKTPSDFIAIPLKKLEDLIYPVGFYRRKAATLKKISATLQNQYDSKVPANKKDLLSLPGVGLKTANLVLGEGFGIPAICVDTHVHRISNRLGLVKTETPEQTEEALQKILPKKYWVEYNRLLVMWGQNICVPISPKCSECPIFNLCSRVGVTKHR